jgi:predicted metal-dependent HD superfamily phosphohydrolase
MNAKMKRKLWLVGRRLSGHHAGLFARDMFRSSTGGLTAVRAAAMPPGITTLRHVSVCLDNLEAAIDQFNRHPESWSISNWQSGSDALYNPFIPDYDSEAAAQRCFNITRDFPVGGWPQPNDSVEQLIMATKHNATAELSEQPENHLRHRPGHSRTAMEKISEICRNPQEYAIAPLARYRTRRTSFMEQFLNRPRFITDFFPISTKIKRASTSKRKSSCCDRANFPTPEKRKYYEVARQAVPQEENQPASPARQERHRHHPVPPPNR